jgi:hypothetical protein
VYFLSNRRNPTGVLFEVYEDASERVRAVRAVIDAKDVDLVVTAKEQRMSGELDPALRELVDSAFPVTIPVDRFTLHRRR